MKGFWLMISLFEQFIRILGHAIKDYLRGILQKGSLSTIIYFKI